VIGDNYDLGSEICGIVCSIKPQEDTLAVWTKSSAEDDLKLKIR